MDTSVYKKGIPSSALKNKWRNMLLILQNFITCEGRFGCMYVYYIRLLMKFLEDGEINLPFFLLNSLKIMSTNVHKRIHFIYNTMHHHGLVKILLEFHLKYIGYSWRIFWSEIISKMSQSNLRKTILNIVTSKMELLPQNENYN